MTRHRRHPRIKLRSFYVWHRYLGVSAAVFVLVLAASGLALNHTETLRLDERYVGSRALLAWYGIAAPEPDGSYAAGGHLITHVGERLFLDTTPLPGEFRELTGVVAAPGLLVVVADGDALLLTPEGELIERLSGEDGVPAGIQAVGMNPNRDGVVVRASHGLYRPDAELLSWSHTGLDAGAVSWSQPVPTPPALAAEIKRAYLGRTLPLERVILDLHSGRILGAWGPWAMDTAAAVLLLLALSGSWMWLKRRR